MQDDQIHINGKPATDAQLRKLTGLEGMEDALWQRNNHVTSEPKPERVEVEPFFWGEDDPITLTQRIAKVQAEFFEGLPEWYTKKKMQ